MPQTGITSLRCVCACELPQLHSKYESHRVKKERRRDTQPYMCTYRVYCISVPGKEERFVYVYIGQCDVMMLHVARRHQCISVFGIALANA